MKKFHHFSLRPIITVCENHQKCVIFHFVTISKNNRNVDLDWNLRIHLEMLYQMRLFCLILKHCDYAQFLLVFQQR